MNKSLIIVLALIVVLSAVLVEVNAQWFLPGVPEPGLYGHRGYGGGYGHRRVYGGGDGRFGFGYGR